MTSIRLKEQLQKADTYKINDSYDFRFGVLVGA
jgi:hypothetical protein